MILEKQELLQITGGALTATLLNAIARVGTFIFDLGKAIGSAIRRATSGKSCPL